MKRVLAWSLLAVFFLGTVATVVTAVWLESSSVSPADVYLSDLPQFSGGTLVIAGGGTLPDEVRQTFVNLAGKKRAKLVIIPAYHPDANQVVRLRERWLAFQPAVVSVLAATSREQAESAEFHAVLDTATGVWLSGGEQSLLSKYYVGTPVESKLRAILENGGVIGGSSAGAAVMTKLMVVQGRESAELGVGFGLLPNAVVDQHFLRRNRMQRLAGVVHRHPHLVGFGIDEETALIVQPKKGNLAVLGRSYVLAIVPSGEQNEEFGGVATSPRYEIMKRGDRITFAGLRSGESQLHAPLDLDALLSK